MEKLNKKGFTLVEILGVIVILSILVLLITAGIMGYFRKGKEDYNEKLKGQLVLAGKSYYSDHNNELPIVNGKNYSYVTLPEIQSNNYIAKSFVDSEGRECSPSYVYVKEKSYNSKDYDYIPCLICQDKNGHQVKYSNSEYCKISDWDDNQAPTCTLKQPKYSDNNNFYITDAKDMINETKQGNISEIIIKNVTTGKEEIIKTKGKQVESINIKQVVKKYFGETSGNRFEVRVSDDSYNLSNNCMVFSTCIELDNKTYTRGTTLPGGYAGGKWTVVSDNGDSVSLAYNGVSGSGGYNNAKNYLTNNFINTNKILKDSMNYGCLVDQGSSTYVSTDAEISDGYTSSNYWTGDDQWYNSETKSHLTLKSTSYVAGIAFNEELKRYQANTNEPNVTATTKPGIIRNTSSNNYDVNRDTGIVTFKNTNSSQYNFTGGGYSNYWSKYSMIHIEGSAITIGSESCTASKNNLCGANYRYQWIDGFGWSLLDQTLPTKNNTTGTIWFIPCGGPDHGKEFYIQSYSDRQYYYSLLGEYLNYSDGYQIIHASMDSTHCNSSEYGYVNCTGNAGGPYTRYYKLYEDYCSPQKEYKLTNTTAQLNYRPYIIVSKNKY